MKRFGINLIITGLFAALVIVLGLFLSGCSSNFEWFKVNTPPSYKVVQNTKSMVVFSKSKDTDLNRFKIEDCTILIELRRREPGTKFEGATQFTENITSDSSVSWTDNGSRNAGGLEFYVCSSFMPDGTETVMGFADINEKYSVGFRSYKLSNDDPTLWKMLSSLTIYESKLPD